RAIVDTVPPPDVGPLRLEAGQVVWTYPTPPRDLAGFRLRYRRGTRANWADATAAHDGLLGASQFDASRLPGGNLTLMVKAVDTSGNESVSPSALKLLLPAPATGTIVYSVDLAA